jgi:hypothetical protein
MSAVEDNDPRLHLNDGGRNADGVDADPGRRWLIDDTEDCRATRIGIFGQPRRSRVPRSGERWIADRGVVREYDASRRK